MVDNPFFSIVIANYNYGGMIGCAIESVLNQDCDDYELIIIDGGSSDNSVNVVKQYESRIAYWISEPDSGQSNAFNKGFSKAKGRYISWLNADDILLPGALREVKRALTMHPECDWATGNMLRFHNDTGKIIEFPWGPHFLPKWLQGKGRVVAVFGPTTFWSKKSYVELGPIDEQLHYVMDTDYWYRLNLSGYKQIRVSYPCWGFRMHEESKTAEYDDHIKSEILKSKISKEREYIIKKNNYCPSQFWRVIGIVMRVLDGSLFKAVYLKINIVGKSMRDVFKIPYNL